MLIIEFNHYQDIGWFQRAISTMNLIIVIKVGKIKIV